MEWIASPEAWIALFTLTVLEIVLGIDNIIFISILVDRLPEHQQKKERGCIDVDTKIMSVYILESTWSPRLAAKILPKKQNNKYTLYS